MTEKQKKINAQLVADLNNKDEAIVLEAIKKVRSLASAEIIPDLLWKWVHAKGEVEHQLTEVMFTLKDKEVIEPLVDALDEDRFKPYREKILTVFWNAGMNPVEHLSTFVGVAIEGTFMECFECLTIIENMEPPFPEEEMLDSLLQLKAYFGNVESEKEEKYTLMRTIATIVKVTEEHEED
jgi:hypothetical protein